MKARMILEVDHTASIEANLEFLDRCEREIKRKRKALKEMSQPRPTNQLDLEEESEKSTA